MSAVIDMAESKLTSLIAKARSIDEQIEASTDADEIADLVDDLTETNDRIIAAPATTLAEVKAKADHLLHAIEEVGDPLDTAAIVRLLRSLAGSASHAV